MSSKAGTRSTALSSVSSSAAQSQQQIRLEEDESWDSPSIGNGGGLVRKGSGVMSLGNGMVVSLTYASVTVVGSKSHGAGGTGANGASGVVGGIGIGGVSGGGGAGSGGSGMSVWDPRNHLGPLNDERSSHEAVARSCLAISQFAANGLSGSPDEALDLSSTEAHSFSIQSHLFHDGEYALRASASLRALATCAESHSDRRCRILACRVLARSARAAYASTRHTSPALYSTRDVHSSHIEDEASDAASTLVAVGLEDDDDGVSACALEALSGLVLALDADTDQQHHIIASSLSRLQQEIRSLSFPSPAFHSPTRHPDQSLDPRSASFELSRRVLDNAVCPRLRRILTRVASYRSRAVHVSRVAPLLALATAHLLHGKPHYHLLSLDRASYAKRWHESNPNAVATDLVHSIFIPCMTDSWDVGSDAAAASSGSATAAAHMVAISALAIVDSFPSAPWTHLLLRSAIGTLLAVFRSTCTSDGGGGGGMNSGGMVELKSSLLSSILIATRALSFDEAASAPLQLVIDGIRRLPSYHLSPLSSSSVGWILADDDRHLYPSASPTLPMVRQPARMGLWTEVALTLLLPRHEPDSVDRPDRIREFLSLGIIPQLLSMRSAVDEKNMGSTSVSSNTLNKIDAIIQDEFCGTNIAEEMVFAFCSVTSLVGGRLIPHLDNATTDNGEEETEPIGDLVSTRWLHCAVVVLSSLYVCVNWRHSSLFALSPYANNNNDNNNNNNNKNQSKPSMELSFNLCSAARGSYVLLLKQCLYCTGLLSPSTSVSLNLMSSYGGGSDYCIVYVENIALMAKELSQRLEAAAAQSQLDKPLTDAAGEKSSSSLASDMSDIASVRADVDEISISMIKHTLDEVEEPPADNDAHKAAVILTSEDPLTKAARDNIVRAASSRILAQHSAHHLGDSPSKNDENGIDIPSAKNGGAQPHGPLNPYSPLRPRAFLGDSYDHAFVFQICRQLVLHRTDAAFSYAFPRLGMNRKDRTTEVPSSSQTPSNHPSTTSSNISKSKSRRGHGVTTTGDPSSENERFGFVASSFWDNPLRLSVPTSAANKNETNVNPQSRLLLNAQEDDAVEYPTWYESVRQISASSDPVAVTMSYSVQQLSRYDGDVERKLAVTIKIFNVTAVSILNGLRLDLSISSATQKNGSSQFAETKFDSKLSSSPFGLFVAKRGFDKQLEMFSSVVTAQHKQELHPADHLTWVVELDSWGAGALELSVAITFREMEMETSAFKWIGPPSNNTNTTSVAGGPLSNVSEGKEGLTNADENDDADDFSAAQSGGGFDADDGTVEEEEEMTDVTIRGIPITVWPTLLLQPCPLVFFRDQAGDESCFRFLWLAAPHRVPSMRLIPQQRGDNGNDQHANVPSAGSAARELSRISRVSPFQPPPDSKAHSVTSLQGWAFMSWSGSRLLCLMSVTQDVASNNNKNQTAELHVRGDDVPLILSMIGSQNSRQCFVSDLTGGNWICDET